MPPSDPDRGSRGGAFADANLPVLLVAGAADPRIISRHKRLQAFGPEDSVLLCELLAEFRNVLVTPVTLTEALNVMRQHREPEQSRL